MPTYEGDNREHFEKPDDGGYAWAERGIIYRGPRGHYWKLVSHHQECGFHMQRQGECDGTCMFPGYCKDFICISERAIGRTFHEDRRGTAILGTAGSRPALC
jgi:hypothetical protein